MSKKKRDFNYYMGQYRQASGMSRMSMIREGLYHAQTLGIVKNFHVFKTDMNVIYEKAKNDAALLHTLTRLYQASEQGITNVTEIFGSEKFKDFQIVINSRGINATGTASFSDIKVAPGFDAKRYKELNKKRREYVQAEAERKKQTEILGGDDEDIQDLIDKLEEYSRSVEDLANDWLRDEKDVFTSELEGDKVIQTTNTEYDLNVIYSKIENLLNYDVSDRVYGSVETLLDNLVTLIDDLETSAYAYAPIWDSKGMEGERSNDEYSIHFFYNKGDLNSYKEENYRTLTTIQNKIQQTADRIKNSPEYKTYKDTRVKVKDKKQPEVEELETIFKTALIRAKTKGYKESDFLEFGKRFFASR